MKIAGLHVLTHHDNDDIVLIVLYSTYTITGNYSPARSPDIVEFMPEKTAFILEKGITGEYHFVYCDTNIPNHLFSRPSPVSL